MKLIEKLAEDHWTSQIFTNDKFTALCAYEAGFRKAREMAAEMVRLEICPEQVIPAMAILEIGEEDVTSKSYQPEAGK